MALLFMGIFLFPENMAASPSKPQQKSGRQEKPTHHRRSMPNAACQGDTAVECWNNEAVRYARAGQLEKAREAIEAAFQSTPQLSILRSNLELLYGRLASAAYDSALEIPSRDQSIRLDRLPRTSIANQPEPPRAATEKKSLLTDSITAPPRPASRNSTVSVPQDQQIAAITPKKRKFSRREAKQLRDSLAALSSQPQLAELPIRLTPLPQPRNHRVQPETAARPATFKLTRQDKADVKKAMNAWAAHWSAQDVEAYLSDYDSTFLPVGGSDRSTWSAQRRERLSAPRKIEVKISAVNCELLPDGRISTTFTQSYRTETLRLRSRKHLIWIRQADSSWKISAEEELR